MKRFLFYMMVLLGSSALAASQFSDAPRLPVRADGFLLAPVDDALARRITAAQDGKSVSFTIAIDGGNAEPLAISPDRLRDYQNVYYRISGQPGSLRLEEVGFSPTGEDEESRLIRRALGIPEERRIFFLPGREHLLVPSKSRVVLRSGGSVWDFRALGNEGGRRQTRAVLVRSGQPILLMLDEPLNSATARQGQTLILTVAGDVIGDGLVAIAKGSAAQARIFRVKRGRFGGNPGSLILVLRSVQALDGTAIPLQGSRDNRVAFVGRETCPLFHGKEAVVPAGSIFKAYIARTTPVLAPYE